jgi:predicted metalloendopeptidase
LSLHASDRDGAVDPGADFYRFANGGWLDANPIPAGYGSWGSFEELAFRNDAVIRELLERAASEPVTELDRMLGDHFAAGMDVEAVDAAGTTAIDPLLDAIDSLRHHADVVAFLPTLHRSGIFAFFGCAVTVDHDDSTQNLLWLAESGLGLPDRDSYDHGSDTAVTLRADYVDHVAAQLRNLGAGADDAAVHAADVLRLETQLASRQMRAEVKRDPSQTLNRHTIDELRTLSPSLDYPAYLRSLGAGAASTVNVQHPGYFAGLHQVITSVDIDTLRAYLRFHVVRSVASALPAAFEQEDFQFYGRRINGQQSQHERSKRVIDALTADMGEALSQRFVDATFSPAAKERALEMVQAIVDEMRRSLETRPWMSDATRAQGITKLDAIGVKIGYPDRWRDWSGLQIHRNSYAANRLSAARFELQQMLDKIGQPVDDTEWEMPPHVVNAYYHPLRNEIVFPAGILQPPMFDAEADDALNFGGIGTVIAHEISHGFDDQGRRFDDKGAFRDWWTDDDEAHFTALTTRLVTQYDAYVAIDDVHVNGRLTLGENIADLGGLALAQRALARRPTDGLLLDGFTQAQRFFLANATIWRGNVSVERARTLVQIDPHSPRHLRVLGPMSNLDAFQAAFGLPDDAPALRARDERIEIW